MLGCGNGGIGFSSIAHHSMGEAEVASMTHAAGVPHIARKKLSDAWVRYTLLRRALGATERERSALVAAVLNLPLEKLIEMTWS